MHSPGSGFRPFFLPISEIRYFGIDCRRFCVVVLIIEAFGVLKIHSLGAVLIILGILVNNYAYMTDLVENSHDGLVYLGWRGIVAAVLGLLAVALGVVSLLRAAVGPSSQ